MQISSREVEPFNPFMSKKTTFIIDVVSEVDPSVGLFVGESYYMRVEEEKVALGLLNEEALKAYKDRMR
jgi:hypothetical protein